MASNGTDGDSDRWPDPVADNWYRELYIPEFVFPQLEGRHRPHFVLQIIAGFVLIGVPSFWIAGRLAMFLGGFILAYDFCWWAVRGGPVNLPLSYVLDPAELRLFRPLRGRAWIIFAAYAIVGTGALLVEPSKVGRLIIAVGGWLWGYSFTWVFLTWGERRESE